jgi:hypothetical protein
VQAKAANPANPKVPANPFLNRRADEFAPTICMRKFMLMIFLIH